MRRFLLVFMTVHCIFSLSVAQDDSIRYYLPPVTVTATRIATPWIRVPLALSVVEINGVNSGKGYGLDEALSGIPGVFAQSRYGNQDIRLSIRGFGSRGAGAKSNAGTIRGIRILLDGFPETEPDGRTSLDLIDNAGTGRIEVVRSNASSVWGNAGGGIINVMSNTGFNNPYADISSSFGAYGYHKENLQLGTTLDAGRFFLSLSNINSDGWRYHSGSTHSVLNTGLVADPGEHTSLGIYVTGTSNLFRIPGPLTQAQYDSFPGQSDSSYIRRDERRFNRIGRLGVSLSHILDSRNSLSASAFITEKYLQRSERGTFRDFNRYHVGGNFLYKILWNAGEEVGNTSQFGIDEAYQDGAIQFYSLTATGSRGISVKDNKREGANNFGAFIQNEIAVGKSFILSLGVRYDNISYFYDSFINPALDDRRSFEHLTPKIGAVYTFSPTQSVYANWGGGVEVPAGNEVDPSSSSADGQPDTVRMLNPLLEPITSSTFEVGTKQIIHLDGLGAIFIVDAAFYWLEVRNDIIPYADGGFYFTAGKTRRMGLETGGKFIMDNGFSLEPSVTISANTYAEYVIDSLHYDNPGKFADLSNNKMAGVPSVMYSLTCRYSPPPFRQGYLKISIHGIGEYFADDRNLYLVPPYSVINAMIGIDRYEIPGSALFLRGFAGINNIADRKYVSSVWINPQLDGNGKPMYLEPGLPRNAVGGLTLGLTF